MSTNQTDLISVEINGIKCIDPTTQDSNSLRRSLANIFPINGFNLTSGREPGYGYFLLLRSDVDDLLSTTAVYNVRIVCGVDEVNINELFFVESWCSSPNETGPNDLMVVKLADYRFLSKQTPRKQNVDPVPPNEKFCPSGLTFQETWSSIIDSYWDNSNNPISSAELVEDTEYPTVLIRDVQTSHDGSDWNTMNDILDSISHSVYKLNSGFAIRKLSITSSLISQKIIDAEGRKISLQQDQSNTIPFLPATIRLNYRQLEGDFHHHNYRDDLTFTYTYAGDVPVLGDYTFDLAFYNIYDALSDPTGAYLTDLNTLAGEVVNLYFDSFANHNKFNATYFGAIDFPHGPETDTICWYHDINDGKYKTKIASIDLKKKQWPMIDDVPSTFDQYLICPPKGSVIPKAVNERQPGVQSGCCLFVLNKDNGWLEQVLNNDGSAVRVVCYNPHDIDAPYNTHLAKRLKSGQFVVEYPSNPALEGDDGTTSTTTLDPGFTTPFPGEEEFNPCGGDCEWAYSLLTGDWSIYRNDCESTTSTTNTTTTPDPSTTTETTTTTEAPPCLCDIPTTTTGTTTTPDPSTTTTSTTTAEPCTCRFPISCGSEDEERTITPCSINGMGEPPPCGCDCTTTTGDPSTSTTTVTTTFDPSTTVTTGGPPEECCSGCTWTRFLGAIVLLTNCCTGNDCGPCSSPPAGADFDDECDTVSTPCQPVPGTTGTDSPVFCTGACQWYGGLNGGWIYIGGTCSSNIQGCTCDPPQGQGSPCVSRTTNCYVPNPATTVGPSGTTGDPATSTTGDPSTSTEPPDPCVGFCDTSTDAPTTTSTTTVAPTSACCRNGECANFPSTPEGELECVNSGGDFIVGQSCGDIMLSNQLCDQFTSTTTPAPECQGECSWLWQPGGTTTTEPTSTVTTVDPCTGTCTFDATPVFSNETTDPAEAVYVWTQTSSTCGSFFCGCETPAAAPTGPDDTVDTNCINTGPGTPENQITKYGAGPDPGSWSLDENGCGDIDDCDCVEPDFDGTFLGEKQFTFCLPEPTTTPPPETGACCDSLFGDCVDTDLEICLANAGYFKGEGTACTDSGICDSVTSTTEPPCTGTCGAICNGEIFLISSSSDCADQSGCLCSLGFIPCFEVGLQITVPCIVDPI